VRGLNSFKAEDRPSQVNTIFQFYHLMIICGCLMIGICLFACFLWWRKKLFESRWLLGLCVWAVLLPQFANQAGWFTAEIGRQPWVVYGLLKTSDALSKTVKANEIVFSLILFAIVYLLLFALFLFLLNKKIQHGPVDYGTRETIDEGSKRDNPIMSH